MRTHGADFLSVHFKKMTAELAELAKHFFGFCVFRVLGG